MKMCLNWPIGVCSWSLQTDFDGLVRAMRQLGLTHVHLDLNPGLADPKGFVAGVREQGWTVTSTMIGFPQEDYSTLESIRKSGGIVPDACWEANRERFFSAIEMTAALDVPCLSSHFGFLDMSVAEYADKFIKRIRALADVAASAGITLLMETGQETAVELRRFLERLSHPALAVNFDPANMILYGQGNPILAVRTLGRWVRHVHIKDAIFTNMPGTWGSEVVWGQGQVNAEALLKTLSEAGFTGALAVEREAGNNRIGDIQIAVDRLTAFKL